MTGRQISYITLILTGDFTFCLTARQILEISSKLTLYTKNPSSNEGLFCGRSMLFPKKKKKKFDGPSKNGNLCNISMQNLTACELDFLTGREKITSLTKCRQNFTTLIDDHPVPLFLREHEGGAALGRDGLRSGVRERGTRCERASARA